MHEPRMRPARGSPALVIALVATAARSSGELVQARDAGPAQCVIAGTLLAG